MQVQFSGSFAMPRKVVEAMGQDSAQEVMQVAQQVAEEIKALPDNVELRYHREQQRIMDVPTEGIDIYIKGANLTENPIEIRWPLMYHYMMDGRKMLFEEALNRTKDIFRALEEERIQAETDRQKDAVWDSKPWTIK